jgi:hypothetical protein
VAVANRSRESGERVAPELTTAALAAGKHVLCEARMAMNAAEGRRMLDASRRAPALVAQLVRRPTPWSSTGR